MLFDKAKKIGLGKIREWLPNGKQESVEWIALNPTRVDRNLGSFKVNLNTGEWADFAVGESGKDVVSLYAYLHRSECEQKAKDKNYKNFEGGVQAEAARTILELYDQTYFPNKNDSFVQKSNTKKTFWSGWTQLLKGIDNIPNIEDAIKWMVEKTKVGPVKNKWFFHDSKGKILFCVVRHHNGKKDDRPYTIWTDGKSYKWRCKGFKDACQNGFKILLYNLPELINRQNDPILLTEGQKCAEEAKKIIGDEWICTAMYGGKLENIDLEPLRGRKVWYWFDPDYAGRKKLKNLKSIDMNMEIVSVASPVGKPAGWDIADAITEGWTKERIIEHLTIDRKNIFLEDNPFPFKIVGISGNDIVFYPFGPKKITKFKKSSLTKNCLMTLADREIWGQFYPRDNGGVAWDSAINDLIRRSDHAKIFDPNIVRGSGAWIDNGKVIFNTGEKLLTDRGELELFEIESEYIYERSRYIPYRKDRALTIKETKKLSKIIDLLPFKKDIYKKIFAGWLLLAPFGGAFKWRPHIWITGGAGTGKTWILQEIIYKMVSIKFGIKGQGTSTPAGVRQQLQNNAISTVMDEMESDIKLYESYIDQNIKMFRESSTGSDQSSPTLHGSPDGEGRQWIVQSMACFASIGAAIKHNADSDRFTLLCLKQNKNIEEKLKKYKLLEDEAKLLTDFWCESFHARTVNLIYEVLKCISVMIDQASNVLGNKRYGDQIGTLMAGYWMIEHNKSCNAAEANKFLKDNNIYELIIENQDKTDEELMLDEILNSQIIVSDGSRKEKVTIGLCLKYYFYKSGSAIIEKVEFPGATITSVKLALELVGIKPISKGKENYIQIAITHPAIRGLLKHTYWYDIYSDLLSRLEACDQEIYGPGNFAGIRKRFRLINALGVIDDIPY